MSRRPSAFVTKGQGERGATLVVCVILLFVLMASVSTTVSMALFRQSAAKRAKEADRAYVIAEAGADRALYELQIGADVGGDGIGFAIGQLGGGSFGAVLDPPFAGPGEYTIRSIGTMNGIERGVSVVVAIPSGAGAGLFGRNKVRISGGMIDSYSSSLGSYASQVGAGGYAEQGALLGSDMNIELSGGYEIHGDATPGPTGLVTGDTSGVSGSTAPAPSTADIDPYVYAPPVATSGVLSATTTLTSGVYRYDKLTISAGEVLTFDGDVELYVDEEITISGSGQFLLLANSKVTIHHGAKDLKLSGGGAVNTDKNPEDFQVFSASLDEVHVSGSAEFHGGVYAPDAKVKISGGGGIFGGALGREVEFSGGAAFHQDKDFGMFSDKVYKPRLMLPYRP